jgi:glycerate 2-kinase
MPAMGARLLQAREILRRLFDAAIAAADPARVLPAALPPDTGAPARVIGAGKAAAAMAAAFDRHWQGRLDGFVVTRYGHGMAAGRIAVREAAHPLPDQAALVAGRDLLQAAHAAAGSGERLVCLLSGGASALACQPPPGISLAEKRAVLGALLRCGADIDAINCVRRHLSLLKGGRLAAAAFPARVLCLAISDVIGDDPAVIGSGPCVPDPSTCADAEAVLRSYRIEPPAAIARWLRDPRAESLKPADPRLAQVEFRLLANAATAQQAAADTARALGVAPVLLGELAGEARELGRAHAGLALEHLRGGRRCVLLSGGETTVAVRGSGRGGRNGEYLLALLGALAADTRGIAALAADTDGIDGTEDNAGAWFEPAHLRSVHERGLDARAALARNDSHGFFAALGTLLRTGPTRTNVNDFRAILVDPAGAAPEP